MKRRGFLKNILGVAGVTAVPVRTKARPIPRRILLQQCELAGFQYYEGERVYPNLRCGDALTLRRTPENKYDKRAVEVYWGDYMLGHLPRVGNMASSQMMDRGESLSANISALSRTDNPWQRIQLDIYLEPETKYSVRALPAVQRVNKKQQPGLASASRNN